MTTLSTTREIVAALRHWGPRWHQDIAAGAEAMHTLWAPLVDAEGKPPSPSITDLAYGPDARQVLDVYPPVYRGAAKPSDNSGLPVLVYVHGGAFVRGEKSPSPQFYANVPADFARHGFIGVNVEYRLAPDAAWPQGACDVRDAVLCVARHASEWSGDARRIFLLGHSAACAHCATAAWDERVRPAGGLPLAGLVLLSPRVVADVRPQNPNAAGVRAYYGDDERLHADRAPLVHVRPDAPPTFVGVAQYENPLLDFYAFELAHRLAQTADERGGPMPRFVQLADHNHVSMVTQFGSEHNAMGAPLRDWMARVLRGEYAAEPRLS